MKIARLRSVVRAISTTGFRAMGCAVASTTFARFLAMVIHPRTPVMCERQLSSRKRSIASIDSDRQSALSIDPKLLEIDAANLRLEKRPCFRSAK
jgi:hypothetical protein